MFEEFIEEPSNPESLPIQEAGEMLLGHRTKEQGLAKKHLRQAMLQGRPTKSSTSSKPSVVHLPACPKALTNHHTFRG